MQDAKTSLSATEVAQYLDEVFPEMHAAGISFEVEEIGERTARMRMHYNDKMLRPGGTISGPSIFTLADLAMYACVLGAIGPVALAVTTNLNINFLRKPAPGDMIGEARLLKLGRRLAVGEIALYSEGETEMVAHATSTYSIPPR